MKNQPTKGTIICPNCGYKIPQQLTTSELFIKEVEAILKRAKKPMFSEEIYNILFKRKPKWKKYSYKQLSAMLGKSKTNSKTIITERVRGKLRTGTYTQHRPIYYYSDPCPTCNLILEPVITTENKEKLLCKNCNFIKNKPFSIQIKKEV